MRLLRRRPSLFFDKILWTSLAILATACSVYDGDLPEHRPDGGGSAGVGGTGSGGTGGTTGNAGSGGTGAAGSDGADADSDIATVDATSADADATLTDVSVPPRDASGDGANDAGLPGDGSPSDANPTSDAAPTDASDASTGADVTDAGLPPSDGSFDTAVEPVVDATPRPDADSGIADAFDGGATGRQILPMHGSPIEKPDASAGPFDSRCAIDEVVTGFVGRAGVQTDAIASTCSKLIGGVLSSPRNLPLNGNSTGGSPFTVTCPANYVAVSIVGRYGHNTMWMEDVTTMIGVVCKDLASATTQTVTITGQPALDAGYTSFREDCTLGRYLTDISGRIDSNSLGFTVQQVGGECELR